MESGSGVTSCRKPGYCAPKAWGSPASTNNRAEGGVLALPGQSRGPVLLLLAKEKQPENLPGERMASKTGWRVSQYFLILIIGKPSHSVYLFLSQSSHWSNLTVV